MALCASRFGGNKTAAHERLHVGIDYIQQSGSDRNARRADREENNALDVVPVKTRQGLRGSAEEAVVEKI